MKTTAIICELNPLHTGHEKLIDYAKTFSDKVICIMSGNFTQRGLPACADKYSRATHAVTAGCDLVVELPTLFATAAAQNFAFGGVSIAKELKVDYLLFGSECGDVDALSQCARLLTTNEINEKIRQAMQTGVAYPKAVDTAVSSSLLREPNNVLAIEYISAINSLQCDIQPITVARPNNYHSQSAEKYASSAALRADPSLLDTYSFDYVSKDIDINVEKKFCDYATLALSVIDKKEWIEIEGVSEGIENRFMSAQKCRGYDAMMEQIKNKRFTRTKLQRIALNAILKITKQDVSIGKNGAMPIIPLAVKSSCASLLQYARGEYDEINKRADNLYTALSGRLRPAKLIKL